MCCALYCLELGRYAVYCHIRTARAVILYLSVETPWKQTVPFLTTELIERTLLSLQFVLAKHQSASVLWPSRAFAPIVMHFPYALIRVVVNLCYQFCLGILHYWQERKLQQQLLPFLALRYGSKRLTYGTLCLVLFNAVRPHNICGYNELSVIMN